MALFVGRRVVGWETDASGDLGERCAEYICVHVWIAGRISEGVRSASVRLWDGEKVIT